MENIDNRRWATVDEYLALQDEPQKSMMIHLRKIIRETVPDAQEIISYQMPAYKYHGIIAFFAAATNHIGLYIRPRTMEVFKKDLKAYSLSKSAIRIPFNKPLPDELVRKILLFAAAQNLQDFELKKAKKK